MTRPKPHSWGRRHQGDPPVWTCRHCGLRARLRGQPWYLVHTELHHQSGTILWPFAVWTTARPPCHEAPLVDPNGRLAGHGHPTVAG